MSEFNVYTEADLTAEKSGKALCDRIGPVLAAAYPGYNWRIDARPTQGIVDVQCSHASGRAGFTFNLVKNGIPDDHQIRTAGGEVLERFKLGRRGFSEDQYRSLPRFCGLLLPEW